MRVAAGTLSKSIVQMETIPLGGELETHPAYPQTEIGTRNTPPLRQKAPLRLAQRGSFLGPPSVDFGVGVVLGAEGQAIGDAAAIGCEFAAEIFRVEAIGGVLDDGGL
jgi:hypothetical protein